jgi:hypothetical protein
MDFDRPSPSSRSSYPTHTDPGSNDSYQGYGESALVHSNSESDVAGASEVATTGLKPKAIEPAQGPIQPDQQRLARRLTRAVGPELTLERLRLVVLRRRLLNPAALSLPCLLLPFRVSHIARIKMVLLFDDLPLGILLRRNRRIVNGECYEHWTLVKTVRTAKGLRQEQGAGPARRPIRPGFGGGTCNSVKPRTHSGSAREI